jgi:uridine phosphorylase
MTKFQDTELIVTPEHRLYHINVTGDDIADDVILVGDPDRVAKISARFDTVDFKTQHREIVTHTGMLNGKRLTVMSTGMGIGCIDIVLTELDAAANIDLVNRELLPNHRTLNIVRLGTCGALQADIPVDGLVASSHAIGMDGLLNFYDNFHSVNEDDLSQSFIEHMQWPDNMPYPYAVQGSEALLQKFADSATVGITATASGFYGPQGRNLRIQPAIADINERLTAFDYNGQRILNFEMETSAMYGMAAMLGHNHLTVCTIIANRLTKQFTSDLDKSTGHLIDTALERLTA